MTSEGAPVNEGRAYQFLNLLQDYVIQPHELILGSRVLKLAARSGLYGLNDEADWEQVDRTQVNGDMQLLVQGELVRSVVHIPGAYQVISKD